MSRAPYFAALVLALIAGCTKRDHEVLTAPSTVDDFKFKPKTAEEMARPASAPRTAIDDFKFVPKTAQEMSRPSSAPRTAIDDFKFVPKTAAEMSAPPAKK